MPPGNELGYLPYQEQASRQCQSGYPLAETEIMILTLLSLALGFYLPVMVLRVKQNNRKMEIMLALPDALDLLVICVEAGQALNAALMRVGRECEFQSPALGQDES